MFAAVSKAAPSGSFIPYLPAYAFFRKDPPHRF
jgi:hypothetical protein